MPSIELNVEHIPPDTLHRIEHAGQTLVLIRSAAGVAAYLDWCPHAGWPLSAGELADGVIECPGHGWTFDPASGRCLNAPSYCLRAVDVTRAGSVLQLEWTEAEPAGAAPRRDAARRLTGTCRQKG